MLVGDDVLFIHAPKTGGTSVVEYLLWNLPGRKTVFVPPGHGRPRPLEWARNLMRQVRYVHGERHATLPRAIRQLETLGRSFEDFSTVLAVVRNPYDLEVSRFGYYTGFYQPGLSELARSGDFDRFVREAGYPWGTPTPIEEWYTLHGAVPKSLRVLRFEHLADDLRGALPSITERRPLRHRNRSVRADWRAYVTPENEPLIHEKYHWLFRYYDRPVVDETTVPTPVATRTWSRYRRAMWAIAAGRRSVRGLRQERALAAIDRAIASDPGLPICTWFADWPTQEYAGLYTRDLSRYPDLAGRLPRMPPPEEIRRLSGTEDGALLLRGEGSTFQRMVIEVHGRHIGRRIRDARLLDYGAGWGRLTRIFMQVIPDDQVDAVDTSPASVDLFNSLGFRQTCRLVDAKPEALPFAQERYDIVIMFSLLTHLPIEHAEAVMEALRPTVRRDGGIVALTIRPEEFWRRQGDLPRLEEHQRVGYAHRPEGLAWGDTTMTTAYLADRLPRWRVLEVSRQLEDWLQTVVFLTPTG